MLREPGRAPQSESYMWLYRTGADTDRPIVLYEYQPGRGAKHPKAFLAGFRGYLHTDGYAGYHSLPEEITVVGCWAHARRKFDEAVKSLPKGKAKSGSAAQGLAYCSKLFELEQSLSDLSPQERYLQRLEQEKPVLDAFLGVGKYPYSGAEVCPGESPYVPEGAVAVPGELLAGWPAGNLQQPCRKKYKALCD